MTRTGVATVLTLLLALTACDAQTPGDGGGAPEASAPPARSDAPQPSDASSAPRTYDGQWQLQSGRDATGDIPGIDDVTLEITGRRFSGSTGCNSYDAAARITQSRLRVRRITRTLMACEPNLMATEERYLDALEAATRIKRSGNTLRITGENIGLEFVPVLPDEPAAFQDTTRQITFAGDGTLAAEGDLGLGYAAG